MANRGPQVTLALSHSALSQVGYVKEMSADELYDALGNLIGWRSVHGRGRTEQAVAFRAWARPQIAALRKELRLRGLSTMKPPQTEQEN